MTMKTSSARMSAAIGQSKRGMVIIHGMVNYDARQLRLRVSDRIANGEAYPKEQVIRLPRRMSRTKHQQWQWFHGGQCNWPELLTGADVLEEQL